MFHDTQVRVAGNADVKRAYMAAEHLDEAAGHRKMLAALVLDPRGKTVAGPPSAGFGG
jgi:hypothetical protein